MALMPYAFRICCGTSPSGPDELSGGRLHRQRPVNRRASRMHGRIVYDMVVLHSGVQQRVPPSPLAAVRGGFSRADAGRWRGPRPPRSETKERVQIKQEFQTLATITFQNYFRMYEKLAGMTGTAKTEAQEFYAIYKLDVAVIPTNMPVVRSDLPTRSF